MSVGQFVKMINRGKNRKGDSIGGSHGYEKHNVSSHVKRFCSKLCLLFVNQMRMSRLVLKCFVFPDIFCTGI